MKDLDALLAEVRRPAVERIDVEARLAAGGMGSIDVATDRALERRIAVKTLHRHLRGEGTSLRMFMREAHITGLLDHPHVVPVYDVGERESGDVYFTMKLVEGRTLAETIAALPKGILGTATLYSLLDVVTKVCDALAFAHSRGVIHCDVKPANVMVGEYGQVYLMDWGIARFADAPAESPSERSLSAAAAVGGGAPVRGAPAAPVAPKPSETDQVIVGTAAYMSPEQARGDRKALDARSDVFLLGALLYEILTRRPPYATRDHGELLAMAAACAFPAPRKVAGTGEVPPELERIVLRAMQKQPDKRYPSVSALREDLVRFMRGGAEFPRRSFEDGEAIVREGEPGDAAFIVVAGACEVVRDTPNGPQTVDTFGPGDVFGEMAILTEGPRTATVLAKGDTTVMVVTEAVLEQELAALKPWMATLLKSLAERFRDADAVNRASMSAMPSIPRLANMLVMHVMTWGAPADGGGARSGRWSEIVKELEAQLGIPPIALFGVISRYGLVLDADADRLTIPDPPALLDRLRADLDE